MEFKTLKIPRRFTQHLLGTPERVFPSCSRLASMSGSTFGTASFCAPTLELRGPIAFSGRAH